MVLPANCSAEVREKESEMGNKKQGFVGVDVMALQGKRFQGVKQLCSGFMEERSKLLPRKKKERKGGGWGA